MIERIDRHGIDKDKRSLDYVLSGLFSQQSGTTDRWYSNETPLC